MSQIWEPTKEEIDRTLVELEPDPILALSSDYEARIRRENRQVNLALFVVCVAGAILAICGLLWLGAEIGNAIDHLGAMPK